QQCREISAIAAAYDDNGVVLDHLEAGQAVIGGDCVVEVFAARHGLVAGEQIPVAAHIEGEANAAERGYCIRPFNVSFLAAGPAMKKKDAGNGGVWRDYCRG